MTAPLAHKIAVLVFLENAAGEQLLMLRAKPPNLGAWSPIGGKLETVDEWRRQINSIYRDMRMGRIPPDFGTKLTYVANVGAQLAKIAQELKELTGLRDQLAQLQSGALITHQYPNGFDTESAGELLPASNNDSQPSE